MSRYRRQLKLIYIFVDILSMYVYIMHILRDKKIVNKKKLPDRPTDRPFFLCFVCEKKKIDGSICIDRDILFCLFFSLSLHKKHTRKKKESLASGHDKLCIGILLVLF